MQNIVYVGISAGSMILANDFPVKEVEFIYGDYFSKDFSFSALIY